MNLKIVRTTKVNINTFKSCFSSTGIPVAWGIMDREGITTLEALFKCMKVKVASANVNTLMTDDGKYFGFS